MAQPADFSVLAMAPWRTHRYPDGIYSRCSMLAEDEAPFLYYLASHLFSGRGLIIDAGSFAGASATCFGLGVRDNPAVRGAPRPLVHCYDRFLVDSDFTQQFLAEYCGLVRKKDESFFDLFKKNTAAVAGELAVHPGDFLDMTWTGERIEILFVDICKTQQLNSHLIREFFGCLEPGVSLVLQQDYYHPFLPWIHITMEYLAKYFEALDLAIGDTRLFRLTAAIPKKELDTCISYDFTVEEQLKLMDGAIERVNPRDRGCLSLVKAFLLWHNGKTDQSRTEMLRLKSYFDALGPSHKWTNYYRLVHAMTNPS